jgi:hypothetical protein
MSDESDALRRLERGIAGVLRAPNPEVALAELIAGMDPRAPLTAQVAMIRGDGLRIAALLVARLRFERLVQGSTAAAGWFEADPAGFARAFRRYHAEVAATAHFPAEEAALFAAWSRAKVEANFAGGH